MSAQGNKFAVASAAIGKLSIAERALLFFSKHPSRVPGYEGYSEPCAPKAVADPLHRLRRSFPQLEERIIGKRVMDLGCGDGSQAIALSKSGASDVLGVDIQEQRLNRARQTAIDLPNILFAKDAIGLFDTVICQDAFEHVADPEKVLVDILDHLKPGGCILLTFGPLWYAPYGAHCHFFTRLPWVHLIFSEATVHRVMRVYRRDPGTSYLEDMNMMTVARFRRIVHSTKGCTFHDIRLRCVNGLDVLSRLPVLREFFVNEISCVITKD